MIQLLVPFDIWADLGNFFSTIIQPLYWAVSWILVGYHRLFSTFLNSDSGVTWVLAIVLLTMSIRTVLIPLFVRQINSARNMQLLQPKVKALQEKYGADREKLGQETMKLYKEESVNPMASCWPVLLQMPIFMSLFWVLSDAARYVANDPDHKAKGAFETNLADLESLVKADLFGARISQTFLPMDNGWTAVQTLALVLIVLMVCCLLVTQLQLMRKNMPPEAQTGPMAQQQKMMLFMFPVIYAIGGISIPIGVLVYWLTTNLWTLCQQYVLIHNNPSPNTPAYVDWEERMIARGKDPAEILAKRQGKRKKPAAEPQDPGKVARQPGPARKSGGRNDQATSTKPSLPKPSSERPDPRKQNPSPAIEPDADSGKKVVKRQQPPRASRAKRKKS